MPDLSANDRIMDRLVGHHIEVLRLADGLTQGVLERLDQADEDTYDMVMRYGKADGTITHGRLNQLLNTVSSVNQSAYRDIGRGVASVLTELAQYEREVMPPLFERMLPYNYRLKRTPKHMMAAIVHEEPLAGGLLEEWLQGLAEGRFARVRNELRRGVMAAEPVHGIVNRIRGTRNLNYRNGVARLSRTSAKALVQTATNHMANKARTTIFRANDAIVTGVMWTAILDDVTCSQCGGLDGEYFPLNEMPEVPIHLNCRCLLVPIFGPIDDDYDMPRPKKLKYKDWLRNQPFTVQNQILGAERGAMFRRGMSLHKFTDNSGIKYNLAELREAEVKTMGRAAVKKRFTASTSKVLKNYGWKPDLPDQRDQLFALVHPEKSAIPAKVSLRKDMPPVFDQGSLGSCTANAAVAAHMYTHRAEQMMSRLDLYWATRYLEGTTEEDSGASLRNTIKALAKYGVCSESTWPYKIRRFQNDPPADADKEALDYRITSYQRLLSHDDFLKCLAQGRPFMFGFSVYDNIFDAECANKGILLKPSPTAQLVGGHAVLATGFDQNFHQNPIFKKSGLSAARVPNFVYEIRNSWGDRFGDAGYFYMDAAILEDRNLSDDFWVIRA
jgi:SPP1 gp7 family putative phage head morphogenesis protein